jgi:hypothetical protein
VRFVTQEAIFTDHTTTSVSKQTDRSDRADIRQERVIKS